MDALQSALINELPLETLIKRNAAFKDFPIFENSVKQHTETRLVGSALGESDNPNSGSRSHAQNFMQSIQILVDQIAKGTLGTFQSLCFFDMLFVKHLRFSILILRLI